MMIKKQDRQRRSHDRLVAQLAGGVKTLSKKTAGDSKGKTAPLSAPLSEKDKARIEKEIEVLKVKF